MDSSSSCVRHWVDCNTLKKLEVARTLEKFAHPCPTVSSEEFVSIVDNNVYSPNYDRRRHVGVCSKLKKYH
ncbi:hypothetical protein TNCV_329521 [Trichonephila clavipes]|nr:hypothetical protein TNCV_329521 [Trichonephila clavipes]